MASSDGGMVKSSISRMVPALMLVRSPDTRFSAASLESFYAPDSRLTAATLNTNSHNSLGKGLTSTYSRTSFKKKAPNRSSNPGTT